MGEDVAARCDIGFSDATRLTVIIATASNAEIVAYRDFVRALIERFGPERRSRIIFRHGYRRVTQIMGLFMGTVGGALLLTVIIYTIGVKQLYRELGWWGVAPVLALGVFSCATWVRYASIGGQKAFDPESIPREALPMTLQERLGALRGRRKARRRSTRERRGEFGMHGKLTVWYNTKCPVCNAGINWQNNRLVRAARAGAIEFRDINLEPDALSRFGAGVNDVRRRLHGVDAEGHFFAGIDCAIEIWRRTPGDRGLARIVGLPMIRPVAGIGYDLFADLLWFWNRLMGHW